jgi:hypothetical protein
MLHIYTLSYHYNVVSLSYISYFRKLVTVFSRDRLDQSRVAESHRPSLLENGTIKGILVI